MRRVGKGQKNGWKCFLDKRFCFDCCQLYGGRADIRGNEFAMNAAFPSFTFSPRTHFGTPNGKKPPEFKTFKCCWRHNKTSEKLFSLRVHRADLTPDRGKKNSPPTPSTFSSLKRGLGRKLSQRRRLPMSSPKERVGFHFCSQGLANEAWWHFLYIWFDVLR